MSLWIETKVEMPKPGRRVLFYWKNSLGKGRTSIGDWTAARTAEAGEGWDAEFGDYDEENEVIWLPEGWYEWGWEMEESAIIDNVTHWMPFPKCPEKDDE